MSSEQPTINHKSSVKQRRWPVFLAAGIILLFMLGAGGLVAASVLEEYDTFCISCHTVPEITYYNRAYFALDNPTDAITDLATVHYHLSKTELQSDFKCIDCHRGDSSPGHRVATLALGARDAVIYVLGKEDQTIEKQQTYEGWLPNAACVTCHTDTLLTLAGIDNHFHTHLPQAADVLARGGKLTVPDSLKDREQVLLENGLKPINTALVCTDCHQAHKTLLNGASNFFMDNERRAKACVTCHVDAQEGPQDVNTIK